MNTKESKSKIRQFIKNHLGKKGIVLAVIMFFLLFGSIGLSNENQELTSRNQELQSQMKELQQADGKDLSGKNEQL